MRDEQRYHQSKAILKLIYAGFFIVMLLAVLGVLPGCQTTPVCPVNSKLLGDC